MMLKDFSNSKIISISLQNRSKGFDGTAFYIKSQYTWFHQAVLWENLKPVITIIVQSRLQL
jgi:hypothetical protein